MFSKNFRGSSAVLSKRNKQKNGNNILMRERQSLSLI